MCAQRKRGCSGELTELISCCSFAPSPDELPELVAAAGHVVVDNCGSVFDRLSIVRVDGCAQNALDLFPPADVVPMVGCAIEHQEGEARRDDGPVNGNMR